MKNGLNDGIGNGLLKDRSVGSMGRMVEGWVLDFLCRWRGFREKFLEFEGFELQIEISGGIRSTEFINLVDRILAGFDFEFLGETGSFLYIFMTFQLPFETKLASGWMKNLTELGIVSTLTRNLFSIWQLGLLLKNLWLIGYLWT